MPHIKVVFLWPYARVRGVHPAYARAYAYAYHSCICIPPTQAEIHSSCVLFIVEQIVSCIMCIIFQLKCIVPTVVPVDKI